MGVGLYITGYVQSRTSVMNRRNRMRGGGTLPGVPQGRQILKVVGRQEAKPATAL